MANYIHYSMPSRYNFSQKTGVVPAHLPESFTTFLSISVFASDKYNLELSIKLRNVLAQLN